MPVRLPLEVYETLEKAVGKEDATAIVRSIETAISEATDYKWATTKEELLDAMRKEFVTKNEFIEKMNVLEEKMTGKIDFARLSLDKKFTIMFLILLFTIIILNINSIEFIAKLFGILK
jgi:predicted DNA-binding protein